MTTPAAPAEADLSAPEGRLRIVDAGEFEPRAWDDLAVRSELGDAFQSHAWGELKRGLGWTPLRYVVELDARPVAAVYIQERALAGRLPGPFGRLRVHYAPRGPILLEPTGEAAVAALGALRRIARGRHALTLTIDPAWEEGGELEAALAPAGFAPAAREIQISRTAMIVPLHQDEAAQHAILGDSTARNINKARRAGVTAERVDLTDMRDPERRRATLEEFFEMHAASGRREGFLVRDRAYELEQWGRLGEAGVASLWFGVVDGRRRNGVLLLHSGKLLVSYAAGAPDDADLRKTRANHLLQWEILRWAAEAGFSGYDLGGVDTHEAPGFPRDESHPLWNLYQFKQGFGAQEVMRIRAHEHAPHASLGRAWRLARRVR